MTTKPQPIAETFTCLHCPITLHAPTYPGACTCPACGNDLLFVQVDGGLVVHKTHAGHGHEVPMGLEILVEVE